MYGCTGVQVPPPFIHFIPMLWGVLACVAILPSAGYYWNHLEPCGTYTTLEPPGTIWNLYDPRILWYVASLHAAHSFIHADRGSRIEKPEARIEDRGSRIEN